MINYDWKTFLTEWNNKLFEIASNDPEYDDYFPADAFERKWLGYPGATEEQILSVEAFFGKKLPPSYRQFLQFTNGWNSIWYAADGYMSMFSLVELWSAEKVIAELASYKDKGWGWWKLESPYFSETTLQIPSVEEYLNYPDQEEYVPAAYMLASLEIAGFDGNEYYLLNPLIVNQDGEWEAWTYHNEAGFWRFPSFYDLMSYQKDSEKYMKEHYYWYEG